jgi:hypothetical protein
LSLRLKANSSACSRISSFLCTSIYGRRSEK